MKKLMPIALIVSALIWGCSEPKPRKPVQVKSGSFFKASVERSKKVLAEEKALIDQLIKNDSLHEYFTSANGFWYYYETTNDNATYLPKTDDEVLLAYNVMNLNGDTIYRQDDIGVVQHAIDKSQLFPGLRNAVKLLKEGEKATFLFPSSQVYGYRGDLNKIGPATPIKSSLQLLKIIKNDSLN